MNSYEYRLVGGYQALQEHTATGRDFCLRDGNHGVVTQTTLIRTVSIMTNLVQQGILCAHCALPPAPDKLRPTSLLSDGLSPRLQTEGRTTTRLERYVKLVLITSSKQSGDITNET